MSNFDFDQDAKQSDYAERIGKLLRDRAQKMFKQVADIAKKTAPLIELFKASIPIEHLEPYLTPEQQHLLDTGRISFMGAKNGDVYANLVDVATQKVVAQVQLRKVSDCPDLSDSLANYMMQQQIREIHEQLVTVQKVIEDVRRGQENDRLATAYSCQQKFFQAISIRNQRIKEVALLRIAQDAEDSRNLLMLSQSDDVHFLQAQPELAEKGWGKDLSQERIDEIMGKLRDNLNALNQVSFIEVMTYLELGEEAAARCSLDYYADYIQKTYIAFEGFVERLDMLDPSPSNYWSNLIPAIIQKIKALPCIDSDSLSEE